MRTPVDTSYALADGLGAIRRQYQVPARFPADVLAAANAAASRRPSDHIDRTALPFVTLDPASSTDLDQAFHIEPSGADLLLHYAIADVGWFVNDGDPLDREAWARGTTQYLPDGKAGLYPPVLAEGAASLLPDGPRPAVIFIVRVAPDGAVKLDGAERALIRSVAKLAYDSVQDDQLPSDFAELSRRIEAAETARGAARVDPPEQEVSGDEKGCYRLTFRPMLLSETRNAALSLATNLAIADTLLAHKTGLFRTLPRPDAEDISRLRLTARAFGLDWAADQPLDAFERTLTPDDAKQAAFMLAIRRAGGGAAYVPYREGETPWHAAMAASYAHATAPLRRLADRYVVEATLAITNGRPVPAKAQKAFEALPKVMAKAGQLGGNIDRAVVDLAEAVMLRDQVGQHFSAIVTDVDQRGPRIQLRDWPVVARLDANGALPGDAITVELIEADPQKRLIRFRHIP